MKEKNMKKSHPATSPNDGRLGSHTGEGRGIKALSPELRRVPFRAIMAPAVLAQATQAAENEGISRSEWIERAVLAALAAQARGK